MPFVKNNRLIKFIFFVMALQVLNMSIDVPVAEMKKANTSDYNFIDTYVEFITEVIFKYENAIPESRHRRHGVLQSHRQVQVICQQIAIPESAGLPASSLVKGYPRYINNYSFRFIKEFNRPPSVA